MLVWIIAVQLVPLTLIGANLLLAPFEARVQRRYWDEAHDKLRRLDPTVIGITGSYGKTSVKHILGHVLETAAPTLITPGQRQHRDGHRPGGPRALCSRITAISSSRWAPMASARSAGCAR